MYFAHSLLNSSGFSLAPEWNEEVTDKLKSVIIEEVTTGSVAESERLHEGDEVTFINGMSIAEVEWKELQSLTTSKSGITCTLPSVRGPSETL